MTARVLTVLLVFAIGCDQQAIVVAAGQNKPIKLVVTGGGVFWITSETAQGSHDGKVMTAPLHGGKPTALAEGESAIDLAVDNAGVYWITAGGDVRGVPLAGGAAVTLEARQRLPNGPVSIAANGGRVYFVIPASLYVTSLAMAGSATQLAAGVTSPGLTSPRSLVADATSLYWIDDDKVIKRDQSDALSAPLTTLVSGENPGGGNLDGLVIDGSSAYWISDFIKLRKVSLQGGAAATLTTGSGEQWLLPAADGADVFFFSNIAVKKVPVAGGPPVTFFSAFDNDHDPQSLAVGATDVFWTESHDGSNNTLNTGSIRRAPK